MNVGGRATAKVESWRLDGRAALVTGAASGIGAATAALFAAVGATVALVDVRAPELAATAEALRAAGYPATALTADLRSPDDCDAVVAGAVRALGRLDILVNNAGVGTQAVGGTVETIGIEAWSLALDVNLRAAYLLSRAAIPHLRTAGGGSIVNVSSLSAFRADRHRPTHAYAASKGGLLSLTRAMAVSYAPDGIRVNAICPGFIRTRLTTDIVERAEQRARDGSGVPLGRIGEPSDVAQVALFFASEASAFVTGTVLTVDGGSSVASGP